MSFAIIGGGGKIENLEGLGFPLTSGVLVDFHMVICRTLYTRTECVLIDYITVVAVFI